jgi:hypothetical protein
MTWGNYISLLSLESFKKCFSVTDDILSRSGLILQKVGFLSEESSSETIKTSYSSAIKGAKIRSPQAGKT